MVSGGSQELLSSAGLPVSGKKEELIARLLASDDAGNDSTPAGSGASTALAATAVDAVSTTATNDTATAVADSATAPATIDAATSSKDVPSSATPAAASADTAAPPAPAAPVELTAEQKTERLQVEEAKRKARSERFGVSAPSAEAAAKGAGDDKLKSRAERFGLAEQEGKGANPAEKVICCCSNELARQGSRTISQSVDALDRALGEKRQRQPKADKPGKPAAAAGKAVTAATKAPVDPELAKK